MFINIVDNINYYRLYSRRKTNAINETQMQLYYSC